MSVIRHKQKINIQIYKMTNYRINKIVKGKDQI